MPELPGPSALRGHSSRRLGLLALVPLLLNGCQPESSTEAAPNPPAPATASEAKREIQEATATVQTPTAGWGLELLSAHQVEDEYWCVFRLVPPAGMAAQVISEVSATARFLGPERPIRLFVMGKTWNWESETNAEFIDSLRELKDALADATTLTLIPE